MNITLNASEASAGAYASGANGTALNSAGTTTISDHGATTTYTLSGNSLSMSVESGQDQVLQQFRGDTGFLQSTRIGSDMNQIHNVITINAGLSGESGISGSGIKSSLDSLRGLRAAGAL